MLLKLVCFGYLSFAAHRFPFSVNRTHNATLRMLGIAADYEAVVRPGEASRLEGKGTVIK